MNKSKDQEKFLKEFGHHLRKLREAKGLSQSEVANRCGKDRQSYYRVENGKTNPTIWYLQQIANALGVELKDLLTSK